jgi:predicted metal-dependent hydrolase
VTDGKAEQLAKAGLFSVRYGADVIPYALRLQPQRRPSRVAIHVEPSGHVLVDAPVGATHAGVARAVKKRAPWIARHVMETNTRLKHVRRREYTSGESVH